MSNKTRLILLAGVLVVGIGGAALAYNNLAKANAAPNTLTTPPVTSSAAANSTTGSSSDTVSAAAAPSSSEAASTAGAGSSEAASTAAAGSSEAASTAAAGSSDAASDPNAGLTLAPDFTMIDYEGNAVKLSDFRGKPVVLNFWASWCPPCKQEMPDFNTTHQSIGEDVTFLMLNMTDGQRETVDAAKKFIESTGYTFPVYFDTEQEAAYTYGVRSIPTTYFINADGYAVTYAMGAINEAQLAMGIGEITK